MTGKRRVIKDWRSTGRKRARKVLFDEERPFMCEICSRTVIEPPPDAPEYFEELWPSAKRLLPYTLQANHKNKDITDCDESNLQWLCSLCHKLLDRLTAKGEIDESEWGYPEV